MTPGEKVLWKHLRNRKFHGLKFRRQVPVGKYVVDFLCVEKRLIIEIDGDSHYQPGAQEQDQIRENYLCGQGYSMLRFDNHSVVEDCTSVLQDIGNYLNVYSS